LSIISDRIIERNDIMENRGGASRDWFFNKTIKTINFKNHDNKKNNQTIKEIQAAITELEEIRNYFDVVDAPELIEYAIYREKAAITRLSYLIRKVKFEKAGMVNL
jgi:hypothetical protein